MLTPTRELAKLSQSLDEPEAADLRLRKNMLTPPKKDSDAIIDMPKGICEELVWIILLQVLLDKYLKPHRFVKN